MIQFYRVGIRQDPGHGEGRVPVAEATPDGVQKWLWRPDAFGNSPQGLMVVDAPDDVHDEISKAKDVKRVGSPKDVYDSLNGVLSEQEFRLRFGVADR